MICLVFLSEESGSPLYYDFIFLIHYLSNAFLSVVLRTRRVKYFIIRTALDIPNIIKLN